MFVLSMGYTYDKVCPKCHGSGICWVCGGDGIIDYMPPESQWCAACHGSGKCYKCDGTGLVAQWMYSSFGATIVFSFILVLYFLVSFGVSYIGSEIHLQFNDWIYGVEDMGFWFNPMFFTWLYATDRKRWIKWMIPINLYIGILLGILSIILGFRAQATQETLVIGGFSSILVLFPFSFIFYNLSTKWLEVSEIE